MFSICFLPFFFLEWSSGCVFGHMLTKQNQFNHGKTKISYFKLEAAFIWKLDLLEVNNGSF